MPDDAVYREIKKTASDSYARGEHHAVELYRQLLKSRIPFSNTKYLDYGCGDGNITKHFSKLISATETHCVEVTDNESVGANDIKYAKIDIDATKLPYPNDTFDVITAQMALHHVKNLSEICSELNRIAAPDALLVIKEHDCWNSLDAMLVDVEHAMYMSDTDTDYGHAIHFKNSYGWNDTLADCGWTHLYTEFYYPNVRNEPTATRSIVCIYKK